jgi:hypothetical protein
MRDSSDLRLKGKMATSPIGSTDVPAYVQHRKIESASIVCPNCLGLPMYVRDVEPHWSMARVDFIYECSDCGAEVKKTFTKSERRH